jgi:hypothetical protein
MARVFSAPGGMDSLFLAGKAWPEIAVYTDFLYGVNEWIIAFLFLVLMAGSERGRVLSRAPR